MAPVLSFQTPIFRVYFLLASPVLYASEEAFLVPQVSSYSCIMLHNPLSCYSLIFLLLSPIRQCKFSNREILCVDVLTLHILANSLITRALVINSEREGWAETPLGSRKMKLRLP